MSILILSTPVAGASDDHDEVVAARLELLIARLVAEQVAGHIGYWAEVADERGVRHHHCTSAASYNPLVGCALRTRCRSAVAASK